VRRAPKVDISPDGSFYFGGRRKATFEFTVDDAADVRVELVDDESGAIVATWDVAAKPRVAQRIRWNGKTRSGPAGTGRYSFRLAAPASASARAVPDATSVFFFADHLFPIRGRHDLGQTPTNDFGGGGTRAHYGQDMFANCGTKLAAARGGKVQYAGYHSAAGNYVVIDGAGTGRDYVYMHLLETPLVRTGDRVFTGQKIGEVGETGRATGCHLHFEMWSAPGWYEGGKAFDPLPALRVWDRDS
ncbi:MAG: peptidoglycan DD-metalloendopeptidase family protein, partial [Actinomycetota bacterium]|nr:peptidoglycan DD-metalloendopeptidase family protein [Actinomycetota bacterium]